MLLDRYGFKVSEGFLAERSGTDLTGTDDLSLARALDSIIADHGLRASVGSLTYRQAAGLGRPFIAAVVLPELGPHSVEVTSIGSRGVTIADPMSGGEDQLSTSEFKRAWTGTAVWISGSSRTGT
jgi:ABC-type bacteriocin/lantibiotic exporter with double-glycine peptidase domain